MRVATTNVLNEKERAKLTRLAKSKTVSVRLARRAQLVLLAADGKDNEMIAEELKIGRVQVGRWRARYAMGGLAAIERDLPRGGRPPKVNAAEIVRRTTQTLPEAATHWSTRTLAAQMGVSDTTVLRVRHRASRHHDCKGCPTFSRKPSAPISASVPDRMKHYTRCVRSSPGMRKFQKHSLLAEC